MNAMTASKAHTMKWLLKREYWEHKGGFFWAPVVIGAIMTFFIAASLVVAVAMKNKHGIHINGQVVDNLSEAMSAQERMEFATGLVTGYMGTSAPLFMVLGFVVFFFCLGALYDERKDRSVLFWKSLPVSDRDTVLSKVLIALGVAPLITLAVATVTAGLSLFLIMIAAAASGLNLFGIVFSSSALYTTPLQVAALLPVYAIWALPTVGWLLMVSAWARTKPFLWAVGVPVLAGALLSWFNAMFDFNWRIEWFWQHIVGRGLLSVAPGSWFGFTDVGDGVVFRQGGDLGSLLKQSWMVFGTPSLWIGAVAGVAMIYTAIRLRRWRDEG